MISLCYFNISVILLQKKENFLKKVKDKVKGKEKEEPFSFLKMDSKQKRGHMFILI